MKSIKFPSGYNIGNNMKPYFVAEINTSHFGDLDLAKALINQARDSGANCVKFQSWDESTLYSEEFYSKNPISRRFVNKFSLSTSDLLILSNHCKSIGIDFASTPIQLMKQYLVNKCNVPFVKIASMELNNHKFLKELSNLRCPLVLSTGMGTMQEIQSAVDIITKDGFKELIVLHCVSIYPCPNDLININNIKMLMNELNNCAVGFSDHTEGVEMAIASVALGACMVEKHFTLDKSRIGMDIQWATDPFLFITMVNSCLTTFSGLGTYERIISTAEFEQSRQMRRSIVAKVDIQEGDVIDEGMIDFMRPGDGISPMVSTVAGKIAKVALKKDIKLNIRTWRHD